MSALIYVISYLIPEDIREEYAGQNLYLLVVTPLNTTSASNNGDPVLEQLEIIKEKYQSQVADFKKDITAIQNQMEAQNKDLRAQISTIQTNLDSQNKEFKNSFTSFTNDFKKEFELLKSLMPK